MRYLFFFTCAIAVLLSSCSHEPGKYRATAKQHGQWGFIDETGEFVIDPEFDIAWSFIRGTAVVKEDGKYGLIDKKGDWIVEPQYDSVIPFSADCFIIIHDTLFGFMKHGSGEIIIPPQYEQVYYYTADLCVVQKGRALGVVRSDGTLACAPQLQDLREMLGPLATVVQSDTTDEMSMLMSIIDGGNVKLGLLNSRGEFVTPCKYDEIFDDVMSGFYYPFIRAQEYVNDSVIGDVAVMIGKYGIVDTTGKIMSEPMFDEMPVYGDGMFRVRIGSKYGYADTSGKVVVPPKWEYAVAFSEGKAIVSDNSNSSIIDKTGKVIAENLGPGTGMYRFNSGRARCRSQDGMYGYMDATGKRIIPPTFDAADDFSDGVAIVSKNGYYGLIDTLGNFLIESEYRFLFDLGDGFFKVTDTIGNSGVVNAKGDIIIPLQYGDVFHLQKNYFMVENEFMSGCFDITGKQIFPTESEVQIFFVSGQSLVASKGYYGLIDTTGKYLVEPVYDSIGYFFYGYTTMMKDMLYGAIDSTGKVVVEAKYRILRPFVNGFAVFQEDETFGYLNTQGEVAIEARFEDAGVLVDPDRVTFN